MSLFVWGLDQINANLDIRESLFAIQDNIKLFWEDRGLKVNILSTCNRFEIYGLLDDAAVVEDFRQEFNQFTEFAYFFNNNEDCLNHMLDLACGLRSSLVGETEILKQLNVWISDLEPGLVKESWQCVISKSLDIRKTHKKPETNISFAQAVYDDIAERFEYSLPGDVYILGTGMMAQSIAEAFLGRCRCHFITGRNKNRARQIAKVYGGRAYYRSSLVELLPKVQLLICATAAPHRVLTEENLNGLTSYDLSDLLIYDLAMPRDVDPALISELDLNVSNLDDLKANFSVAKPIKVSL